MDGTPPKAIRATGGARRPASRGTATTGGNLDPAGTGTVGAMPGAKSGALPAPTGQTTEAHDLAANRRGASSASQSAAAQPDAEAIRRRAYLLYLERGGHHGADFDDWLRAERELKQQR
jgi:hypothetical protein